MRREVVRGSANADGRIGCFGRSLCIARIVVGKTDESAGSNAIVSRTIGLELSKNFSWLSAVRSVIQRWLEQSERICNGASTASCSGMVMCWQ